VTTTKVNLQEIKVVAFDCDGVMFDTRKANRAYYDRMLDHFHLPAMTDEQFAYVQQHTVYRSIEHIFQDETLRAQALKQREVLSYFGFIKDMEIEPGLILLLKKIRPFYHTAIATNRSNTMNAVLEEHQLVSFFDLVVTALDVENAKPAPDQLIKLGSYFSVEHSQIFYIGDSELDERAANQADVVFAAYRNKGLKADFHIDSLSEVESILNLS